MTAAPAISVRPVALRDQIEAMIALTSAPAAKMTVQTADQPEKAGSTGKAEMIAEAVVLSRTVAKAAEARPGVVRKEAASAVLSGTVTTVAASAEVQTVRLSAETEKITAVPVVVTAVKEVSRNQAFLLTAMTVASTAAAMTAEKEAATEKNAPLTGAETAARTEASTARTDVQILPAKTGRFPEIGPKTAQTVRPAEKVTVRMTAMLHVKTGAAKIVLRLSRDVMTGQSAVLPALTATTATTGTTAPAEVIAKASKKAVLAVQTKKCRKHLSTT